MAEDLSVLEREEAVLANVLVRNKLVPESAVDEWARQKRGLNEFGKPFLGEVLKDLKFLTQADLDQYVKENEAAHVEFVTALETQGYLSKEQMNAVNVKRAKTGGDLVTVISELNIMTKESYIRLFNNRSNSLRLGEWLLANGKLTKEQLDAALQIRNITHLEDYLVHRNICQKAIIEKVKEKIAAQSRL